MNARKGLALVIANSNYINCHPIESCIKDGQDIAKALNDLEFDVIKAFDTDRKTSFDVISKALTDAELYETFVFYYSGHGAQIDGKNYIVPVDYINVMNKQALINTSLVDLKILTDYTDCHSDHTNIIILDACRNSPRFEKAIGTIGLAEMRAGSGTFISFATAPNTSALGSSSQNENSIFTKYLLRHINKPNLKVEDLFKLVRRDVEKETDGDQTPWESTSLKFDFQFNTVPENTINEQIYQTLRGHDLNALFHLSEYTQKPIVEIMRIFEKQKSAKPGGILLSDDDIEILILHQILEAGFTYKNYRWFYKDQVVNMGEFLHDPNNIDTEPILGKEIMVAIEVNIKLLNKKNARIYGKTNLPEKTIAHIEIVGMDIKYRTNSKIVINANNEFVIDICNNLNGQSQDMPLGSYSFLMTTPFYSLQDASVQETIGIRARNLTGENVYIRGFEKFIEYKSIFILS